MYTDNSENLIPGVNQFPHTHSAETETHILFCPKSAETFDQQGFDKDGSKKPVKSRLCRQQADGAFIKNEYEDRKRRIFEICVFFYWAFCFTLRNEQTTANAIEWTSIDGVFLLSGKEQKNGNNT